MIRTFLISLITLALLSQVGCKSKTPPKKEQTPKASVKQATPKPKKSDEAAPKKKVPEFVAKIPPLVTDDVNDLKKLTALRQYNLGLKLQNEKEFDKSIEALLLALQANPGHLSARYQLAVTLALQLKPASALAVLEQFANAKDCARCYVMLARAKTHPAFKIMKFTREFRALTDGPAERLDKEMAAASWITYNKDELEKGNVNLSFDGLPAISADGERILAVLQNRDANDQLISATLQTLNSATGERKHASRILFEKEGLRLISGKMHPREFMRSLDDRISHIHSELISEKWQPLALAVSDRNAISKGCGSPQKLQIENLEVSLSNSQLTITDGGGKTLSRDAGEWRLKGHEVCATTPMIKTVYQSKSHKTLLLELSFCSDTCQSQKTKWTAVRY